MNRIDYVNILQGTKNSFRYSHGNVLPIAGLPHGNTGFSVQTDEGKTPFWFDPDDRSFEGFRLTRQPSPWIRDYGQLAVMPSSRAGSPKSFFRYSQYDPAATEWSPYAISARLLSDGIFAELAPAESGAVMRFTFTRPDRYVGLHLFEGENELRFADGELSGKTTAAADPCGKPLVEYFYLTFSAPVTECVLFEGEEERSGREIVGRLPSVRLRFGADRVEVRLSVSYLSLEQAKLNASRELDAPFEEIRLRAKRAWEKELSAIDVEGDEEEKKTFYSCLYRACLFPRKFHEFDKEGTPRHLHPVTREIVRGVMYTDNGFWDTYRTLFPLYSLIYPGLYAEMLEGFCNFAEETGALPRWLSPYERGTMPGSCLEAVIADAAVKGILSEALADRFLPILKKQTGEAYSDPRQGRQGIEEYKSLGYLPFDLYPESVSKTLDYAYGDFCAAVVQSFAGENSEELFARSKNYKNLFDAETGFLRAKDSKGNFRSPFDPKEWGKDYTESCAWQNAFSVFHDVEGLERLYGGKEALLKKADELFAESNDYRVGGYRLVIHEMNESLYPSLGQCAICNQPSFHLPWLYALCGRPEKTERVLDRILPAFGSGPSGFCGDEDNGSMASWYIFSALGLYPFCPGKAEYVCVTPRIDAVLHCGGKDVRFRKGEKPAAPKVSHEALIAGGKAEKE